MSDLSSTGSELVYQFDPTVPNGTAKSSPYTADITTPNYEVQLIRWRVPPGPNGEMGWQLWYADAIVLPQNKLWIVASDEYATWELDELPTAGSWQFQGYNTGTYDHTVYLTFLMNPLSDALALPDQYTVQSVNG